MAYLIGVNCDHTSGFLWCSLPADTIDVDFKVKTLRGIHTYKKDYNMYTGQFSS